jgi:O-antigen ligase
MPLNDFQNRVDANSSMTAEMLWRRALFCLFGTGTLAIILYGPVRLGYEPAWGLVFVTLLSIALIVVRKWPMPLLAGLLFVGNFKTIPAQGISLTDPTFLLFLLCFGSLSIDLLFILSGTTEWSLRRLFSGEAIKIVLFLAFVVVLGASYLYSPVQDTARTKLTRFLAFEVLCFFAPIVLMKNKKDLRQFLLVFLALSLALCVKELFSVLHPSAAVLTGEGDVTKIGDGMLFASSILIVLYSKALRSRAVTYGLLAVMSVGLVAAAARSPMLALIATLIISLVSMSANSGWISRGRLALAILLIACIAGVALVWVHNQAGMQSKITSKETELASVLEGATFSGGTIGQRQALYKSSFEAFAQYPIFGLGLDRWGTFYSVEGVPAFPHNFVLEVAAEQGLVGLAVLAALLVSLFRAALRMAPYPAFAFLYPMLTFHVIYNLITGNLENRDLWFWFGMVVAASRMFQETLTAQALAPRGAVLAPAYSLGAHS